MEMFVDVSCKVHVILCQAQDMQCVLSKLLADPARVATGEVGNQCCLSA